MALAMNTGFNYYQQMPVQNSIESVKELRISPVNALQQDTPFEFCVEGSQAEDQFLDLYNSYFYFRVKVTKADGTAPVAATAVSCVQNLAHSMFSRIEVFLQDRPVNDPHGYYPYSSYITDLLQYGQDAKATWMRLQGWWGTDTAGKMDDLAIGDGATNLGLKQRYGIIGTGASVELCMTPHVEIFNSDKYIPPGLKLRVRFTPALGSFVLTSGLAANADAEKAKVVIEDAIWYLPAMKATHAQAMAVFQALREVPPYRINLSRTSVKTLAIAANQTTGNLDNIIIGPIPNRIIIAMVKSTAAVGNYKTYPFRFEDFGVSNISLSVNGTQVPTNEFHPNFTAGSLRYKREYLGMLQALNRHKSQIAIPITPEDFLGGYCLWIFDLTPDRNSDQSHSPLGSGNIRFDVIFRTALVAAVTVIIHSQYDAAIEIDQDLNVRTVF